MQILKVQNADRARLLLAFIASALLVALTGYTTVAKADSLSGEVEPECFGPEIVQPLAKLFGPFARDPSAAICKTGNPTGYRLVQIFDTMRKLSINPTDGLPEDETSMNRFGYDWVSYVHGKTLSIQYSMFDCEPGSPGHADMGQKSIQLCPNFYDTDKTDIMLGIETLMHEAAHLRTYIRHVKCTSAGEFQGSDLYACDQSLSAGGAYAVSVEVNAKLATRVNNISPIAKDTARSRAITYALTRFNEQPYLKMQQHPYVLTQKGQLAVFKNGEAYLTSSDNGSGLIVPGYGDEYLVVPTGSGGKFSHLIGAKVFPEPVESFQLAGLKSIWNGVGENRGVHLGSKLRVAVRKNKIEAICLANKPGASFSTSPSVNLSGKGIEFVGVQYPDGFDINSSSVTVLTTGGVFGDVTCDSSGQPHLTNVREASLQGLKKAMKIGDEFFGLTFDGKFVQILSNDKGEVVYRQKLKSIISDFTEKTDFYYLGDRPQADVDTAPVDIPTTCIHCN